MVVMLADLVNYGKTRNAGLNITNGAWHKEAENIINMLQYFWPKA